jgi:hypothetical protein
MLKLERVLNVSSLGDPSRRLNIESEVRRLTSNIRFNGVNLLSNEAKQQLRDFAASDLMRVNFTAYSILVSYTATLLSIRSDKVNIVDLIYSWNRTSRRSTFRKWQPF